VLDEASWTLLRRLTRWLDQFKSGFGHRAQRVSLREYIDGLLGDSPRKSMEAMLARVTEPRSYQAFQHFITHAPWNAQTMWQRLLAVMPERQGVLILDDTPFLKQGTHSVGVARQYASTQKRVTNCQVAVTAALWTGARAWLMGAELYLPEVWLTPDRRAEARIPPTVRFQEKWRLALTLVRRVRAAGIAMTCVLADAAYGDIAALRTALDRLYLLYVVGISSDITVFQGTPRRLPPGRRAGPGRPPRRPQLAPETVVWPVAKLIAQLPARRWRRVSWRNGENRTWTALFAAVRVTPVVDWRSRRVLREVWLLAERAVGAATPHRYYFSNLPPTASVGRLARLVHQRWAIEQQYQDLKSELGLDHFEGRTYPGWHHHVVLSAVAYGFLQAERRRHAGPRLTFPQVRAIAQEIFTGVLFITRDRYWNWLQRGRQYRRYLALRL
jgi:SRSO17 transposase